MYSHSHMIMSDPGHSVPPHNFLYFSSRSPFHSLFHITWALGEWVYVLMSSQLSLVFGTLASCESPLWSLSTVVSAQAESQLHSSMEKCIFTFNMSLFFFPQRMGLWYVDHEYSIPFSCSRHVKMGSFTLKTWIRSLTWKLDGAAFLGIWPPRQVCLTSPAIYPDTQHLLT